MKNIKVAQSIINDIKNHVETMKDITLENAKIQRMTGITNQTYKVSLKNQNVTPVIYRRFGQSNTNVFLDRQSEKIIYKHVSNQQLGPKIHCYIGEHTRIEEFIDSRVLKSQDMLSPQAIQNVAFALQKFHSMDDPQKIQKKSIFKKIFFQNCQEILQICHQKLSRDIYNQRQKQLVKIFSKWITKQQIQFLKNAVQPLQKQNLVFSHNDLLANNVLIKNSNNKYIFIDFEYSTYNYLIYDIANYFNEFEFNYDVKEPPYFGKNQFPQNINQIREEFIRNYILAKGRTFQQYLSVKKDKEQISKIQNQVDHIVNQFELGTMLSNILWGWWAVIVCKNQNIDFDYLQFCKVRYDNYQRVKESGKWKLDNK